MSSVRISGVIAGKSENFILLHQIKNKGDSRRFNRKHLWISLKGLESFQIGDCISLTGDVYYYHYKKMGLKNIRCVYLED